MLAVHLISIYQVLLGHLLTWTAEKKDIIIWFLLLRIIDYTDPYDIEYACFMLSKPPPLPQWQAFVTPLQPPVFFKLKLKLKTYFISNLPRYGLQRCCPW